MTETVLAALVAVTLLPPGPAEDQAAGLMAGTRPPAADEQGRRAGALESALAQFSATDIHGRRWTAADLRGRVVLLDFWATWCAPCLAELPQLERLRAKHSREDFEIIGISLDVKSRRSFISWLNRHRIPWPQVHERTGYSAGVPRSFGVDRLPTTVLIGRDGTPLAVDLRGEALAALVDELVARGTPVVEAP